ncbi:hypothetical protein SARC_06799 [Sphaeroforma arctica JP610]|uniref:Uncharacterized protein n=1 Tax=Sphaeroforma arctica JP610 TaxID=667725 RepID=A0A0L0FY20_9EUKA|nr:hypothetical protein SARC_06799 [Sphaeroforma arctica JP610]KNC80858.1 hypothetical protein SARC_06799 [Sphaeroforma arctica JP610]|eukprot:XP_014154760.1 hypothetical protein SARC_06799 [Sphaeroforma arctica JP610]
MQTAVITISEHLYHPTWVPIHNLVGRLHNVPDQPPAEMGDTKVMHIHDLVDESYVQNDVELMEDEQIPEGWKAGTNSE